MKRLTFVVVAAGLVVLFVRAAAQAPAPPKPGPEVQKLQYFVGQWKFDGDNKESPFGPAGKFSGTETCEWFAGGFQVICRGETTAPTGKATTLSIVAYDQETKEYTYYGIDSTGFSALARGTVKGDTWTYTWSGTVGGKPAKIVATMQTSPSFYTGTTEAAFGGGPLAAFSTVKETRVR